MRRPRFLDHDCPVCGAFHVRFCETDDDGTPINQEVCGPQCETVLTCRDLHGIAPPIVVNKANADFKDRERERLEKRSSDHWKRVGRDEGYDREKTLMRKYQGSS